MGVLLFSFNRTPNNRFFLKAWETNEMVFMRLPVIPTLPMLIFFKQTATWCIFSYSELLSVKHLQCRDTGHRHGAVHERFIPWCPPSDYFHIHDRDAHLSSHMIIILVWKRTFFLVFHGVNSHFNLKLLTWEWLSSFRAGWLVSILCF